MISQTHHCPTKFSAIDLIAGWAVLCAVVLISLVPVGFMPDLSRAGKVAVVICSGVMEKTIYVDPATGQPDGQPDSQPDKKSSHKHEKSKDGNETSPCSFFALKSQGQMDAPVMALLAVLTPIEIRLRALPTFSIVRDGTHTGFIARAPPASTDTV